MVPKTFDFEILKLLHNFFLSSPPTKLNHILHFSLFQINVLFHIIYSDTSKHIRTTCLVCIMSFVPMFSRMTTSCWIINCWVLKLFIDIPNHLAFEKEVYIPYQWVRCMIFLCISQECQPKLSLVSHTPVIGLLIRQQGPLLV